MLRSETIKDLAAALAIAQGAIQNAAKDSANPFFNSSYADLASVRDAIREPFAANGLSVMQLPAAEGQKVTITTMLAHKSGEWVSSDLTMTAKDASPQAIGSAITYARRYALSAIAGVAPEDDDGEGAEGRTTATAKKTSAPKQAGTAKPTHTPAQQAVIDQKLAEASPWLPKLRAMYDKLGETEYLRVLGNNGFTSAKEIRDAKTADNVLKEMGQAYEDQARSRGVA